MGVTRWLVSIEPDTWHRASARIQAAGSDILDRRAAEDFLREFGRNPSQETLTSLEDADDENLHAQILNGLLETAVTDNHWFLDKSLSQLEMVVRALPEAKALLKVIAFKGLDTEPPEACRDIDGGLYGCCTAPNMQDCLAAAQKYRTPQDVLESLESSSPGLISRVLGGKRKIASARAIITDDYYSHYWGTLTEAIEESTGRNKLLGLGMSA